MEMKTNKLKISKYRVDKIEAKQKTMDFYQIKQMRIDAQKYSSKSDMKIFKLIGLSHKKPFHIKLGKKIFITSLRTW